LTSKVPLFPLRHPVQSGRLLIISDIRNIIHWDLSATVEEYTQQIGRAGRDGETSHCMFYICPDDFYIRENFARGDLPSRRSLKGLLEDIFNENAASLPEDAIIKANHYAQSKAFDVRLGPLGIIYAALELRFGLIRAITPEYTQYSFESMPRYYQVLKADKSKEVKAIFSNAVKKAKYHHIDVTGVAEALGLLRIDLVNKLNELDENGCIKLKASGVHHRYRILSPLPSTDGAIDELVDKLYADLEFREEEAIRRTQQVADLITGAKCFALALAEHFGMRLPGGKLKCGHCQFCITGKRVVLPPTMPKPVYIAGIKEILRVCNVRDDPRFLARVAFGIKSPRVMQLGLDKSPVFRSLADHDFKVSNSFYEYGALRLI
jgi:hypothetical protein